MHTTSVARAALVLGLAAALVTPGRAMGQARRSNEPSPRAEVRRGTFSTLGPTLGIEVRDVNSADLASAGLSQPGAAMVTAVETDGAAQRAGVAVGDLIVEFDGERVRGATQLVRLVRESVPDRAVKLTVVRDKTRRTFDVTPTSGASRDLTELSRQVDQLLRDLPRDLDRLRAEIDVEGLRRSLPFSSRRRMGVEVQPLTAQLASHFGVSSGLLVAHVEPDSPAAMAGVTAGDVITAANGRSVRVVDDLVNEVTRGPGTTALTVVRDKKSLSLEVTVPAPESQTRPRPRGRSI